MTITLTLPVLVAIVLVALVTGGGIMWQWMRYQRLEARVAAIEGLFRDWLKARGQYVPGTEMAVSE